MGQQQGSGQGSQKEGNQGGTQTQREKDMADDKGQSGNKPGQQQSDKPGSQKDQASR